MLKRYVALAGMMLAMIVPADAATLTVNGSQKYQLIDGFGVNANHRSWNNNDLKPALDALIDQAGMSLFHVIFDNNNWETTNDNANASVMNWGSYTNVYSSAEFQQMWSTMAYLNQRGITNGLVPDFEGPVALWMGGLTLSSGMENEYAETIASALVYARNTQHLHFSIVGPINEPDITYTGIHLSGAAQWVTVMHDLAVQLDANGLGDIRFSGPDLANTSTSWLGTIMTDSLIMSKLAHWGLHSYLNQTADASGVYDYIQQSNYKTNRFWMTEFNVWCSNCQGGSGGDDSWSYARSQASFLLTLLGQGASGAITWEGYDSQYVDFNANTGGNNPPHWSYWGLLAVTNINASVKTYTPRKGFYTLAQTAKFVRPGSQRIGVSGAGSTLSALAFYNTNTAQFTLTGVNTDTKSASVSCSLTSLPTIPSVDLYYTTSSMNLSLGGHTVVSNNSFTVSIPADCVFTVTYSNSVAQRPPPDPPALLVDPPLPGSFELTVTGTPLQQCTVEVSQNMTNWSDLTNVTLEDGTARVSAPRTGSVHFYRARVSP